MRKSREPDYFKTPYLVRQAIRNRNSLDSIKKLINKPSSVKYIKNNPSFMGNMKRYAKSLKRPRVANLFRGGKSKWSLF